MQQAPPSLPARSHAAGPPSLPPRGAADAAPQPPLPARNHVHAAINDANVTIPPPEDDFALPAARSASSGGAIGAAPPPALPKRDHTPSISAAPPSLPSRSHVQPSAPSTTAAPPPSLPVRSHQVESTAVEVQQPSLPPRSHAPSQVSQPSLPPRSSSLPQPEPKQASPSNAHLLPSQPVLPPRSHSASSVPSVAIAAAPEHPQRPSADQPPSLPSRAHTNTSPPQQIASETRASPAPPSLESQPKLPSRPQAASPKVSPPAHHSPPEQQHQTQSSPQVSPELQPNLPARVHVQQQPVVETPISPATVESDFVVATHISSSPPALPSRSEPTPTLPPRAQQQAVLVAQPKFPEARPAVSAQGSTLNVGPVAPRRNSDAPKPSLPSSSSAAAPDPSTSPAPGSVAKLAAQIKRPAAKSAAPKATAAVPKVIATTETAQVVDPETAPPQLPSRIRSNSTSSAEQPTIVPVSSDSSPPPSEADGGPEAPAPALPKREKRRSRSQERVSAYVGALPPNPIPRMIAEQKRIEAEKLGVAPPTKLSDLRASSPTREGPQSQPPPTKPKPGTATYVGGKSRSEMFADLVKQEVSSVAGQAVSADYQAVLEDAVRQADLMDSSKKYVMMYRMKVTKNGVSWTIFRRFNQFFELDKKLRHHGLWPKDNKLMPPKDAKRSRDDSELIEERKQKISYMMQQFLLKKEIQESSYIYAFLEPVQIGDIRPGQTPPT